MQIRLRLIERSLRQACWQIIEAGPIGPSAGYRLLLISNQPYGLALLVLTDVFQTVSTIALPLHAQCPYMQEHWSVVILTSD